MSRWSSVTGKFVTTEPIDLSLDDAPHGSEGGIKSDIWSEEVTFGGRLRDYGWNEHLNEAQAWFESVIQQPSIARAYLQIDTDDMFVFALHYTSGAPVQVWHVPDGFIRL